MANPWKLQERCSPPHRPSQWYTPTPPHPHPHTHTPTPPHPPRHHCDMRILGTHSAEPALQQSRHIPFVCRRRGRGLHWLARWVTEEAVPELRSPINCDWFSNWLSCQALASQGSIVSGGGSSSSSVVWPSGHCRYIWALLGTDVDQGFGHFL